MDTCAIIFGRVVMWLCAAALAVCAVVCLASIMRNGIHALVAVMRRHGIGVRAGLAACAVAAILYGGTKVETNRFHFFDVNGIPGSCYATNDLVHIEWAYIPDTYELGTYTVYVTHQTDADYRAGLSNWSPVSQSWDMAARMAEYTLPNATNYHFKIWSEWKGTDVVVTNGVYHLSGFDHEIDGTNKYVSLRVSIRINDTNGVTTVIAPINERLMK